MSETNLTDAEAGELILDPFAYQPGAASAIQGLGGGTPHQDPSYAFHTAYVPVAEGPAQFTLRFQGLSAKTGTLHLRVHMFVDDGNPRLLLANSLRIQFNRLIQLGSEVSIRFDGFKQVKFALYGNILGQTDARADLITVVLDRPAAVDDSEEALVEVRNTDFGLSATRSVPSLIEVEPPTLAHPVAQAATISQAGEPIYAEWCKRLGLEAVPDRAAWSAAYVLQSLRAYGLLQSGAAGLGFATAPEAMMRVMEEFGASSKASTLPVMPEELPGNRVNFDFLWTIDVGARAGVAESFGYVDALMKCLRPGGLAVHVVPFEPGMDQRAGGGEGSIFRRADIERLSLTMISRNVETSQVKIACDDAIRGTSPLGLAGVGAFGLVFRKPPLAGA